MVKGANKRKCEFRAGNRGLMTSPPTIHTTPKLGKDGGAFEGDCDAEKCAYCQELRVHECEMDMFDCFEFSSAFKVFSAVEEFLREIVLDADEAGFVPEVLIRILQAITVL